MPTNIFLALKELEVTQAAESQAYSKLMGYKSGEYVVSPNKHILN